MHINVAQYLRTERGARVVQSQIGCLPISGNGGSVHTLTSTFKQNYIGNVPARS